MSGHAQAETPDAGPRTSVDAEEVARFSAMADEWWDEDGPFRPLHRLNPVRIGYLRDQAAARFELDRDSVSPLRGLSALDVGCGGGLISEPLRRLGAEVTAIDASETNIGVARAHADAAGLEIGYRCATAEQLVEEGATFDLVVCLEVVEHVADLPLFVGSLARLTKPSGLLVLSTINRTAKSYALAIVGAEYVLRWLPKGTHDWRKFVRPSELEADLRASGMRLADLAGVSFQPFDQTWRLTRDLAVNYMATALPRD